MPDPNLIDQALAASFILLVIMGLFFLSAVLFWVWDAIGALRDYYGMRKLRRYLERTGPWNPR